MIVKRRHADYGQSSSLFASRKELPHISWQTLLAAGDVPTRQDVTVGDECAIRTQQERFNGSDLVY